MATDYVTNRLLLRFADEVKTRFAFLEALNFHCIRTDATAVRFESPKLAINVYHGRQSYEIGLEIESTRVPDAFSFSEILRLVKDDRAEQYRSYAAHTAGDVAEGVRQLAELFRKCIDTGILEDSELFSRLQAQRDEWARNYALEVQLEQARKKLESAWTGKDFRKVVQVLTPLQEHLSPSELKKLEYAKDRSKS